MNAAESRGPVYAASLFFAPVAIALAIGAAIGLMFGIRCRYEWAAIGGSLIMSGWSIRWALKLVGLYRPTEVPTFTTIAQRVQSAAFASAAVAFAIIPFVEGWWPRGWWAMVVAIQFAIVALVYYRDSRSRNERGNAPR